MTRRINLNGSYKRIDVNDDSIYIENNPSELEGQPKDPEQSEKREYREFNDNRTGEKREGWRE